MKKLFAYRYSLPLLLVLATFATISCETDPELSITARINEFLDDLEAEDYEAISRNFHSDADINQVNDPETWDNQFNAPDTRSYSWNEDSGNRSTTTQYDGKSATRVPGTVSSRLKDDSRDSEDVRFIMRQDDANWLIRAIEVEGDKDGEATIQDFM